MGGWDKKLREVLRKKKKNAMKEEGAEG